MAGNVQDYELLLRVRADLQQALAGTKGLASSIGGVKAAADAAGESADQAAERIRKMVQATGQQEAVQESARSQAERASQAAKASVTDYDAQAAAIKRAADATAAYRERLAANNARAAASAPGSAIAAQRAELVKLVGQIDPTVAALGRLDAQEAKLNQLRKSGVVGVEDYQKYKAAIDESRVALTTASGAVHTFTLNNANARRELGYLAKDLATGQYGRLSQSALTLASNTGLMGKAFSLAGLAIGGVAATLAVFILAARSAATEQKQLNEVIALTGNYAGISASSVDALARRVAGATGSISDARDVILSLARTGTVGSDSLDSLTKAAVTLGQLTGQSAEKAAAEVVRLFDGTAAGAAKANEQYHFLNQSQYEQIKALEDQGDKQAAVKLEADAFFESVQPRLQSTTVQVYGLAKAYQEVANSVKGLIGQHPLDDFKKEAALFIGTADIQTRIDDLKARQKAATPDANGRITSFAGVVNNIVGLGFGPQEQAELDKLEKLKDLQDKLAADSAKNAKVNADAIDAAVTTDAIEKQFSTRSEQKQAEITKIINAYNKRMAAALAAGDQTLYSQLEAKQAEEISRAQAFYDKKDKVRVPRASAAVDNAAIAAQQQLIKLLGDEQGALDPVAKIWATYNDEVDKANALADKAKLAKGANIAAIDAERDALVKIYATARDNSLAALADKDRQAWEKLRDSLRAPVEAKADTAIAQLKELNGYLQRGTINAQQYQDALKAIGEKAVINLPKYKGVDAVVGGAAGELAKNYQAQSALDQAYAAQLKANNDFRSTDLAQQKIYDAEKANLDKEYADQSVQIAQARTQLSLAVASEGFGRLADIAKSAYGEQSKQYEVLFALSKAFAVAQAAISLATNVSKASEVGFPANVAFIAGAFAQGAEILSIISGATFSPGGSGGGSGYDVGGYTGPGGRLEPAGIVHKGEVVWSQKNVADAGGVGVVEALRLGKRGFYNGGFVGSPSASTADLPSYGTGASFKPPPTTPGNNPGGGARVRIINAAHPDLVKDYMNSSEGEQIILNTIGKNRTTVKAFVAH